MSRPSIIDYYQEMLKLVSSRSTCARRAVGAIIVDGDNHVLSTGYNGTPSGFQHCTDVPCEGALDVAGNTARCMAIHAEINAIIQCTSLARAATMFVSCSPCFGCAKVIANTRISTVVCSALYADKLGINVLYDAHVKIIVTNMTDEDKAFMENLRTSRLFTK